MAFTREFIRNAAKESGVEIPKELEDALVQEHISARDAYSEGQVKTALENNKPGPAPKVEDSEEYKTLKQKFDTLNQQFDTYKHDHTKKETHNAKKSAYRELLKSAGVSENRIDTVLRVSKVDDVELDDSGKIKGADKLTDSIKTEWADFISQGNGYVPPAGTSTKTFSPDDIRKMTPAEINKNFDAIKASLKGEN